MRTRTRLGGGGGGGEARQLGWASCFVSAGRVTLSGGTTFSHINTLARIPEAKWLKLFPEPEYATCLAVSRETSVLEGTAVTTPYKRSVKLSRGPGGRLSRVPETI